MNIACMDLIRLPWDILLEIIGRDLDLEDVFMIFSTHPSLRRLEKSKSLWIMILERARRNRPLKCSEYQELSKLEAYDLKQIALHAVQRDKNLGQETPSVRGPVKAINIVSTENVTDLQLIARAYGTPFYIFRHKSGLLAFDMDQRTSSPNYTMPSEWKIKHSCLSPDPSNFSCFHLVLLVKVYTSPARTFKLISLSMEVDRGKLTLEETFSTDLDRTKTDGVYEGFIDVFAHRDVVGATRVRAEEYGGTETGSILLHAYSLRGGAPVRLTHGIPDHESVDGYLAFVEGGKAFGLCSKNGPDIGLTLTTFGGQLPFHDKIEGESSEQQHLSSSEPHKCWTPGDGFPLDPEGRLYPLLADDRGLYSTRFQTTVISYDYTYQRSEKIHAVSVFDKVDDATFRGSKLEVAVPSGSGPAYGAAKIGWGTSGCLLGWLADRTNDDGVIYKLLNISRDRQSSKLFSRYFKVPDEICVVLKGPGGDKLSDLVWDEHRGIVLFVLSTGTVWMVPYA